MNSKNEINRRDRRIANDQKIICELKEEIKGLHQLLDCAAANIVMLVRESKGKRKISRNDVSDALGKYRLFAKADDEGNYILEIKEAAQKCPI